MSRESKIGLCPYRISEYVYSHKYFSMDCSKYLPLYHLFLNGWKAIATILYAKAWRRLSDLYGNGLQVKGYFIFFIGN